MIPVLTSGKFPNLIWLLPWRAMSITSRRALYNSVRISELASIRILVLLPLGLAQLSRSYKEKKEIALYSFFQEPTMARIIWSWQCCRLLVGNIANGIASKNFFAFLTELGNFKQKYFWRQCHWQCCQTKVCSIVKSRWFGPILISTVNSSLLIYSCYLKLVISKSS